MQVSITRAKYPAYNGHNEAHTMSSCGGFIKVFVLEGRRTDIHFVYTCKQLQTTPITKCLIYTYNAYHRARSRAGISLFSIYIFFETKTNLWLLSRF